MRKHRDQTAEIAAKLLVQEIRDHPTHSFSERFLLALNETGEHAVSEFLGRNLRSTRSLKLSHEEFELLQNVGFSEEEKEMTRRQADKMFGTFIAGVAVSALGYFEIGTAYSDLKYAEKEFKNSEEVLNAQQQRANPPPRHVIESKAAESRAKLRAAREQYKRDTIIGAGTSIIGHVIKAVNFKQLRESNQGDKEIIETVDEFGEKKIIKTTHMNSMEEELKTRIADLKNVLDVHLAEAARRGQDLGR